MTDIPFELHIDAHELNLIDGFRQNRNTSVLTILFTDIQGFTQLTEERGDAFSNELRRAHDGILGPVIERDGSGRIIKHIGDAVMAVFSEPSTAVARCLEIQQLLRRYNEDHPGQPPLLVRMGLHMGQVTVEDKMSLDIFGRHVNRASRVEALAEGGHLYMTYSVMDSAKSWLAGHPTEGTWVSHGRYLVKGIDEPIEVFEAYRPGAMEPQRPKGGRRQSVWPRFLPGLGLVFLGALGVLGVLVLRSTSVTFEDLRLRNDTDLMLDHRTRLQVTGTHEDHLRKCLSGIEPGNHLLHYDVSYVTRYYAPITVARGKNILRPRFEYFGMPGIEGNMGFRKKGKNERTFTNKADYATYDDHLVKHDHKVVLTLTMKAAEGQGAASAADAKGRRTIFWTLEWIVALDGAAVSSDKVIVEHAPAASVATEGKRELWGDDRHRYVLSYRCSDTYAQGDIQAQYSEYK